MRKFLIVLFTLMLTFSMLIISACEDKEPLILKQDVLYASRNNGYPIAYLLDLEVNNISKSDVKIICDSDLIYFEDGMLRTREALGDSSCTITAKGKSAKLEIKIITILETYEKEYEDGKLEGALLKVYLATKSLINCLDDFKKPSSVEVVDCWAFLNNDGSYKYFIYEIRAENSFGGNVIGYYKINANGYSISSASEPYYWEYDQLVASDTVNRILKDYLNK